TRLRFSIKDRTQRNVESHRLIDGHRAAGDTANCVASFVTITNVYVRSLFTMANGDFCGRVSSRRRSVGWRVSAIGVYVVRRVVPAAGRHDISSHRQSVDSINATIVRGLFSERYRVTRELSFA